ncbi:uncharacterized protein [Phaseolus vulgaris]|uniref:uncharacterized protein n=1 Tax=Phaseolus vulgaris TaxID=3885 RepID=UPI0035CC89FA
MDYKEQLKHRQKQMSLSDLITHIIIEDTNRKECVAAKAKALSAKANVIEDKPAPKRYEKKFDHKKKPNNKFSHPSGTNPTFKKKGNCFVCGKPGHHAPQCRHRAKNDYPPKANLAEGEDTIVAVVSQVNLNVSKWVVDSGATRHICANRNVFTSYTSVRDGEEQVYLGDSRTTLVLGKGKVLLKLTYGKTLALNDVLHVPSIRVNLVSVALLSKVGVKVSFESDKIVMTKNNVFVGKGYCIIHEVTPPYSSESNGVAERKNRTLKEMMNAMLISSNAPDNLWGESLLTDKAIKTELDSIKKNNTWTLVDLPKGAKPIGCKWIFKKKYHPDGSIEKYKARLVAKGFTKKHNIDYFDTFAPVTRISSIRVLLALTSIHKLVIHQMDVKTTFLNGELEEEIYMTQPEGCVVSGQKEKKNRGESISQTQYAQIIGSLLHLMSFSRPDIAYAVGRLSRYTKCPSQDHWEALARLMKYLRGTMDYAIEYSGFPAVLEGYNDANWISDSDETKSTSGYVFTLGGGAVT